MADFSIKGFPNRLNLVYIFLAFTVSPFISARADYSQIERINSLLEQAQNKAGNLKETIRIAGEAYQLASENNYQYGEAGALSLLARSWANLQDNSTAIDYYFKELKIRETLGDINKIAECCIHIGELYRATVNYSFAMEYSNKALIEFKKADNKGGIAWAHNRLAAIFYEMVQKDQSYIDSTYYHVNFSLKLSRRLNKDQLIVSNLNILGSLNSFLKKYQYALSSLNEGLAIAERNKFEDEIPLIYLNIANTFYAVLEYRKAIDYALKGYTDSKKLGILQFIDMSTLILFRSYEKLEDYRQAFEYLKIYEENRSGMFVRDRDSQLLTLGIKYETEQKERALENEKKVQTLQLLILTSIIMLILLIVWGLYLKNRFTRKKNGELEEKNRLISLQNESLTELNVTKDKFFSIIAHDLKNPFASLLGFSTILLEDYEELSHDEIMDYLKYIFEASENGNRLLQNLLDWSRAKTGTLNYEPAENSIRKIVSEAVDIVQSSAIQKEIAIKTDIRDDVLVGCDRNMICTVMRNLLSNAIKFSNRNGKILVTVTKNEKVVEVAVRDYGIGMSEEIRANLFNINNLISHEGTEQERGTGLGLLLCKEFIEKHNGEIWAVSEINGGSCFHFTLLQYKV